MCSVIDPLLVAREGDSVCLDQKSGNLVIDGFGLLGYDADRQVFHAELEIGQYVRD